MGVGERATKTTTMRVSSGSDCRPEAQQHRAVSMLRGRSAHISQHKRAKAGCRTCATNPCTSA